MKKLFVTGVFLLASLAGAPRVFAAVSLDSSLLSSSLGSPKSFSYTIGAGADLLVVCSYSATASDFPTGITANGVALTLGKTAHISSSDAYDVSSWYLDSPTAASTSIIISGAHSYWAIAASFIGTGGYDVGASSTPTSVTSAPITFTTSQDADLAVGCESDNSSGVGSVDNGTILQNNSGSGVMAANLGVTPAGSFTMTFHFSGTHNADLTMLGFKSASTPPSPSIGGSTSTIDTSEFMLGYAFFMYFVAFFGVVWLLGNKH